MKKKVLIIAYYFPPLGGGGVQRTLKFVKYLPSFGWEPVVLTAFNSDDPIYDRTLLQEIPNEIKVYRTFSFEITKYERNFFSWLKKAKKESRNKEQTARDHLGGKDSRKLRDIIKGIYLFFTIWLRIPDSKIGWMPFAFLKSLSIISSQKIDLIFVTSPPHSSQLLGFLLKKITRKPLVADFRNEWLEKDFLLKRVSLSPLRLKFEKYLCSKVFKSANCVIANNDMHRAFSLNEYPFVSSIQVITNGYDAEDLDNAKSKIKNFEDGKFHLCHTGYFYPRTAYPFLEALKEFFEENPDLKNKFQLNLVGYLEKEYQDYILKNKLEDNIRSWGQLSHIDAIRFLLKSHLLLYIIGKEFGMGTVAGKLYEYLASGRPILGLVPKGSQSAKLIEQANCGWVLDLKDKPEIKNKLKEIYQTHSEGKLNFENNWDFIQNFDRKKLTKNLSEIFNQCLINPKSTSESDYSAKKR